jgi:hypothetical protein
MKRFHASGMHAIDYKLQKFMPKIRPESFEQTLKDQLHLEKNTMKKLDIQKIHDKWRIFCFTATSESLSLPKIIAFEVGDF